MSSYSSAFTENGVTVVCCDKCDAPNAHYIGVIDGWFCDSCSIEIGEGFLEDEEETLEDCPCCNTQQELYTFGGFSLKGPLKFACFSCANNGKAKAFYKL